MPRPLTLALAAPSVSRARIVAMPSGETLSLDELADRLVEARVVYVGEHHDRAADHEAQRAIVEALHARDPQIAIGLEMVQRPYQPALDD